MKLFYFNNILNSSIKYNHELGEFLETWQILIHEGDRHNMGSMSFRGVVRCIALFFVYLKILNNFINGPVFSSSFITCLMCFLLRFFIWCWFFIVERDKNFWNLFLAKLKTVITFTPGIRTTIIIYAFGIEKNFPYYGNLLKLIGDSRTPIISRLLSFYF